MTNICNALTKKGTPCVYRSKDDSGRCAIHRPRQMSVVETEVLPELGNEPLDMGILTKTFPREIIREMLKNMNAFDMVNFAKANRSCNRFVKAFDLINNSWKIAYPRFVKTFKATPCLINAQTAKEYDIPIVQGQDLIVFPFDMVGSLFIEKMIHKSVKIKFKILDEETTNWTHDRSQDRAEFGKKFVKLYKTQRIIVDSQFVRWNFQEMFIMWSRISRNLQEYQSKHPEMKLL